MVYKNLTHGIVFESLGQITNNWFGNQQSIKRDLGLILSNKLFAITKKLSFKRILQLEPSTHLIQLVLLSQATLQ